MTEPATTTTTAATTDTVATATTVKPGIKTTEFYFAKIIAVIGALMAAGYIADGTAAARICGAIMVGAAALGYPISRGLAKGGALLVLVLLGVGASSQLGCAALKSAGTAARNDAYSCGKAEPKKLIAQFGPSMVETVKAKIDGAGKLDVDALKPVATALETDASRCVLTAAIDFVAHLAAPSAGSPQSSPMAVDTASLAEGYHRLEAEVWGGKTYELGGAQ